MQHPRKMIDYLHPRPQPSGLDVSCKLQHFAIITYAFPPERFASVMPPRLALDTVEIKGQERALLSVVPFMDVDFTSAVYPFPKFRMGQTNYRIYIIDRETGERCVWFLGTTLDSWTRFVPHTLWKLPWFAGHMHFDYRTDGNGHYQHYEMRTQAQWAPAHVVLKSRNDQTLDWAGFPNEETALVYLTHPLRGFYYRRDGKLGTYRVWHDRLQVHSGELLSARFDLLDRLGLVSIQEQQQAHSVLIEPINEFTVYLPPQVVSNQY